METKKLENKEQERIIIVNAQNIARHQSASGYKCYMLRISADGRTFVFFSNVVCRFVINDYSGDMSVEVYSNDGVTYISTIYFNEMPNWEVTIEE